jgi:hypothetical protein
MEEYFLCLGHIGVTSFPTFEHRRLQGTTIGEGECPRPWSRHGVDGVQVLGGLDLGLAAGEEDNA